MRRLPAVGALCALGVAAVVAGALAQSSDVSSGRIGPASGIVNNGRHLQPFAQRLVTLGNFPTGGALTPDGRFYWTVDTGRGVNDVKIVSVAGGAVVQTLTLPGASGGVAIDPTRPLAYVSGVAGSTDKAEAPPAGAPGATGDVIHVFRYDAASGQATFDHAIAVPPPAGAPAPQGLPVTVSPATGASPPQNFPPTNSQTIAWPDRLSISPDGATLLVPLNLADAAAVIDAKAGTVRYVKTGDYPYGSAILPDGKTGLVSNETPGTVSVIDLASATKKADIQVGPHLSHPEAIAVDPKAPRAYVALANSDQVAVIDTSSMQVARTLSIERSQGLGTSPVALTVSPDGSELLVAEAGADELSVFRLQDQGSGPAAAPAFSLIGRIPTGQYPADVQVVGAGKVPCAGAAGAAAARSTSPRATTAATKKGRRHRRRPVRHRRPHRARGAPKHGAPGAGCAKLLYISAKGLGTGPNPLGPNPTSKNDSDDAINAFQYLPLLNIGSAEIADMPAPAQIAGLSAVADAQVRPTNPESPPAGTPLRAGGPIKHVFYIVRENRTYDQVLGDVAKGDGDPKLTLFGSQLTPNAHALVGRFPLLDHFYANSEASIDGHFWTSSSDVSDYVHKAWFQNYRAGGSNKYGRPYDFIYAVTWSPGGSLFDQALSQGISFYNYGEAIGDVIPLFPDKDRTQAETQRSQQIFAQSDLGSNGCYPNDASIGKDAISGQTVFDSTPPAGAPPGSESRAQCFQSKFASQLAQGSVPTFNYMVLSNDHTRVLSPGAYTPQAMVADNDYGLGQIVDTISHSSIWNSSAIFVTEDDSQDGADHVDAHRTVGLVISPFARQGAVVHTRYDMPSMIRSMELIMGMRPLTLFDALATPMYDAFSATPSNAAPFSAVGPKTDLLATNPAASSAAAARALRFRGIDQLSQREEDRLLWRAVHGAGSTPPPPGPNAVVEPQAGRAAGFDG
jgi:DNA-binding beta-propeller fold protein YncE